MLDIKKIAKEHKKLFPKADRDSQYRKYLEEFDEWVLAPTVEDKYNEAADCIICCIGLYNYDKRGASYLLHNWRELFCDRVAIEKIEKLVNEKWEINKKRKWEFKNGVYHHIED